VLARLAAHEISLLPGLEGREDIRHDQMTRSQLGLLIGAGFSKWAADLPVANGLFDFNIEPFGPREVRNLEIVRREKLHWDLSNPGGYPEQFIEHILASPDERGRKAVLWYIVRRLSEPHIWAEWGSGKYRRHVLMIDEDRKFDRPGVREAQAFLHRLVSQLSGIVTTNYDLLIEYALGTKLFNYGLHGEILTGRGPYPVSQWKNPVSLKGAIPLAKVHGSISWDAVGRYTDGRRGLSGKALIVAPTPEKTPPDQLRREWLLAASVLQDSSRLLVFGFGFNPYDEAILCHLRANGRRIRDVMLVDTSPKPDLAKQVWPDSLVSSAPPPPDGTAEIDAWLRNRRRGRRPA
jgi:hypothetical protein